MRSPAHAMMQIPQGKSVGDMVPVFSDVKQYVTPLAATVQKSCASCRKPFSAARRPELGLRCYPVVSPVPIAYEYRICGRCEDKYRTGGSKRNRVLAAVQKFMMG